MSTWYRKIFLTCLAVVLCTIQLWSQDVLKDYINVTLKSGTRAQYLDSIQNQINRRFLYASIINPQKEVSVPIGKFQLETILDTLFFDQFIRYIISDDLIILSPTTRPAADKEFFVITGRAVTRRSEPVAYATVYMQNSSRGTITNSEGYFSLTIPTQKTSDTLIISSIGFETAKIPPTDYLIGNINIDLKVANYKIKNLIVRPIVPNDLIEQSYKARKDNYSTEPVLLTAFFRETARQNDEYISLTEALVEISKSNYLSNSEDLIRLIKGRNGENTSQSDLVNLVVEGGLYNGLRLDVVKYNGDFYSADALNICDYRFQNIMLYNDRQTYELSFKMKDQYSYLGYEGKLYIDAESLALVRAEFELNEIGLKHAKSVLVKKTPRGFKVTPEKVKYEVEYRYYNNLWNLHYARTELNLKVKKFRGQKHKGFTCNFIATSEFVVTGQSTQPNKRIKYSESSKISDILVEQVKNTSEQFWSGDNIITPEEPLQKTILRLQHEGVIENQQILQKENPEE